MKDKDFVRGSIFAYVVWYVIFMLGLLMFIPLNGCRMTYETKKVKFNETVTNAQYSKEIRDGNDIR